MGPFKGLDPQIPGPRNRPPSQNVASRSSTNREDPGFGPSRRVGTPEIWGLGPQIWGLDPQIRDPGNRPPSQNVASRSSTIPEVPGFWTHSGVWTPQIQGLDPQIWGLGTPKWPDLGHFGPVLSYPKTPKSQSSR